MNTKSKEGGALAQIVQRMEEYNKISVSHMEQIRDHLKLIHRFDEASDGIRETAPTPPAVNVIEELNMQLRYMDVNNAILRNILDNISKL